VSTIDRLGGRFASDAESDSNRFRVLALAGVASLTTTYLAVLFELTAVPSVGGTPELAAVVLGSFAGGYALSRTVGERVAALLTVGLVVAGGIGYLLATPLGVVSLTTRGGQILTDAFALLTGWRVLKLVEPTVWILGFAPAPTFITTYLALRRRYVAAVGVSGLALAVLIMTGDAPVLLGRVPLLFGAVAGIAAVGFGELERRGGTLKQVDVLIVLFAAMLVISSVPVLPGSPLLLPRAGGEGAATVEGSLTAETGRAPIVGSIELSPEVRFKVQADKGQYWRAATYDRFTGQTWLRSGESRDYSPGLLDRPPGDTDRVSQTFEVFAPAKVMPAANQPVEVRGDVREFTKVTRNSGIQTDVRFREGDRYSVVSAVPNADAETLRATGTDYPSRVQARYTEAQGLSDTFTTKTEDIVSDAENPYETAVAIEGWLEGNREYSLDTDRPSGNIAEQFLLEMEQGYCTYYATTMVMMLRSQDIPARFVVGYTPGQQVDDNEWVVRGLNSHAWVEVYFEDVGWVQFDPTPSGPRQSAEVGAVEDAREGGQSGVDVDDSENAPLTTTTPSTTPSPNATDVNRTEATFRNPNLVETTAGGGANVTLGLGTDTANGTSDGAGDSGGGPIPPETILVALVALVGLAAGVHRTGGTDRALRTAKIHWQGGRTDPETDVRRALERLELLLERHHRPRHVDESPPAYVQSLTRVGLDEDVIRAGELYEHAVYGDGVNEAEADEVVAIVDDVVRAHTPLIRRLR
jgi:transglutaminase-like putative cysteine protease